MAASTEAPRTEGDSALLVSISEAEPVVGALRLAHDPVASEGVPAHVTVLYPFVPRDELTSDERVAVAEVFGAIPAFDYRFEQVRRFGSTTVYLVPEPAAPFARLTEATHARWPQYPPYGGAFDAVIPHLTVADGLEGPAVDALEEAARSALSHYGPIVGRAAEVTLITWDPMERWSVDSTYPLAEQR